MTICILTPRFPFPQYGGDALRINEIARHLKRQGHHLVLVSLSDEKHPDVEEAGNLYDAVHYIVRNRYVSYALSLCSFLCGKPMQVGYYRSHRFEVLLRRVVAEEKPDLYISHLLRMAPYLIRLGVQQQSIVELTDALSKTYAMSFQATSHSPLKYLYRLERHAMERYEKYIIRSFPKVVLVSEADEQFLREKCEKDASSLCTYTNGVHVLPALKTEYQPHKICFVGNMRSLPNQDAVIYFVKSIFPIIKQAVPGVHFYVIGSLPPPSILALASYDVIVTGYIDNLESEIASSAVMVAPVRVAAGIQNKILQSMACGVPVVLTDLLAKAIPQLEDGVNCRITDGAEEMAKACIQILKSPKQRNKLAQNGYQMVSEHYSWESNLSGYEQL